ncbi:Altered inheritance of mitochondria protein 9, mitochondrial [Madurella mycetomatis]|uniref:Altered inheritance of mitochondria protein 9, mitochondrial n=1 Tax=Madurella mycetomatis TaxID=100816 RepID=A0A175WCD1_9PEZI|nr:Altered inheritance of mitochondria protein 9, mitochondrial [Madurella mycetomatis]
MHEQTRDGLAWDDSGFDLQPCWAREPQLDAVARVCRAVLGLTPEDHLTATFHAAGAFNKLYLVVSPRGRSLMRVSLPVDPKSKTGGEVTTLRWIRRMTHMPVPKVIAFDDSQDNEIGFEWILMELMPGESAYKRWRKLSIAEKTWLVEQIAEFQSQLFRSSFENPELRSIGTLFSGDDPEPSKSSPRPGRIVSRIFFWGEHFHYDVARGPYRSSYDWLSACLGIIRQAQTETLDKEEDEDIREDAEDCLRVATRLTSLLPKIFPLYQSPAERTVLWHDDLSLQNILIDDDAKVTAVVDWECVSAKPLWVATEMPKFLDGEPREEEPDRDKYGDASEGAELGPDDEDKLDDEGKTELYWIHLMEYEQTQLRKVYIAKMKELWPQWEREAECASLKSDFLGAVDRCADGWYLKRIEQWIDAVEAGAFPRLMDILSPNIN